MVERKEIEHLATLARLRVTDDEADSLAKEVSEIIEYVAQVKEIAQSEKNQLPRHRNILRADSEPHSGGLFTESLLQEAAQVEKGSITVHKIISND